jgi:ABC-2 type transport system permease protein
MIGVIARKEFTLIWRDGRIKWTAGIIVLMLTVAAATAVERYRDIAAERGAAQALVEEQWQSQGEKNPHAAAHYGIYAFKPVTPLAFFDTGVSNYLGVSIWLEAHKRNRAVAPPAQDMTAMLRFGELTAAFTLQVLLPLFVILMAFPAFAGEREDGTLRQVLSTGVTAGQLFLGKGLGILAAVALLVLPLFALGLVALLFTAPAMIPQATLLLLTYSLYALVFLALTLAVSARARSAQAVLVIMVALWAVFTFAIPRVAADASALLYPIPTDAEFQALVDADLANGLDGVSPAAAIRARQEQTLKLYKKDRIDELPINFQGVIFSLQEELGARVFDRHFADLDAKLDRQLDIHEALGLLSPRLPVQAISMELSGSSLRHHQAFARAAEDFRLGMIEVMNRDLTFNSRPGEASYRAGPELWAQVGSFSWAGLPLSASLTVLGPSFITLLLWLAVSLLAAFLTARDLRAYAS